MGETGETLLSLSGVHTHIGQYHILHGVDLEVPRGQLTMLLGRNGAGKTTTMRTIMGLWQARQGAVRFAGEDIARLATPDIARRGIAYVPENMGIFGTLTVEENMVLAARRSGLNAERLDWIYSLFPAMRKFWRWPAGQLSGGQKQMLAISRAIIEPAELLLVDEPTKGLAPTIIDALAEAIMALKQTGVTILMVEQNFALARRVGDTVAVMDDGKIIHTGTMAELGADTALQGRLLGLDIGGGTA
ncbi:ABC transporter ATP-binding protein [Pelagibacterium lacus]|uniref:ABC transporter ATP-binding protein n=1 Tax=Pelagibacterium lacus TaxID=2282655 RepID=A0A369W627_9HYPH|nr:ABC transporter ATP-binding protein [Pelagibacterium lacus]RDE10124.1 ABC transporter ATP-binding protein [Pelagibacterium lacus]